MLKAIVLGATSGIGREIALLLAIQDHMVGATGRRADLLESLSHEHPDRIITSCFDLTTIGGIESQLTELIAKLGGLDLLILSSGVGLLNEELDIKVQQETIDLNIMAFTAVTNFAFSYFNKQGSGHICCISSIAGLRGNRQSLSYSATKAYQINYLQGLNQKVSKNKLPIYITDVRPGFVATAMAKGDGMFWVAPAKKAAVQILNAINKKRKVVYVTRRWKLIALLLEIIPDYFYNKL